MTLTKKDMSQLDDRLENLRQDVSDDTDRKLEYLRQQIAEDVDNQFTEFKSELFNRNDPV